MKLPTIAFALFVAICSACAPRATSLTRLSLSMEKRDVIAQMGQPSAVRGAIRNRFDQTIEVWEYRLYRYKGAIEGLSQDFDLYWMYFVDDKLVQWGQAGDWKREADRIYEIRFR